MCPWPRCSAIIEKNVVLGWGARYIDGVVFNVYAVFTIAYLVKTLQYRISTS